MMKGITMAQFGSIVLGFVVVAIIISMGGEIFAGLQETQANGTTSSVTNDTINFAVNDTCYNIVEIDPNHNLPCITGLSSASNLSTSIAIGNFSTSGCQCREIKAELNPAAYVVGIYNVTYAYSYSSDSWNITGEGLEGAETFGDWLPTIAIVISAAVIIGIIITYFHFR